MAKKGLNSVKVYGRIKEHYRLPTDAELARFLGKTPQMVYNWKERGTVDLDLILSKCPDVDLNWLFRGTPWEGSKELADLRARVEALESARKTK